MSNYLLFATKNGLVKKTEITEYANIRASGLIALKMDQGDSLLGVKQTSGEDEVILVSGNGKSIRFTEKDIRPTGRATRGVRGIRLGKHDTVVGMDLVGQSDSETVGQQENKKAVRLSNCQTELLIVTQNGYGKMTPVKEYSQQGRGGKGVFTAKVTKKTGKVVEMKLVSMGQSDSETVGQQENKKAVRLSGCQADLLLISSKGQVIRLPLASVPTLGRQTQGVHLINLSQGDTVAALTLLENE